MCATLIDVTTKLFLMTSEEVFDDYSLDVQLVQLCANKASAYISLSC